MASMELKIVTQKLVYGVLFLIALSSSVMADGAFYASNFSPEIPDQRAVISYLDGRELLIVQSNFTGVSGDFGWVIPVPAEPEFSSIDMLYSDSFFHTLLRNTAPRETLISATCSALAGILVICLILLVPLLLYRFFFFILGEPVPRLGYGSVIYLAMAFLLIIFMMFATLGTHDSQDVEMLSTGYAGVYDVKVIKASNSGALLDWLNENKYQFTKSDEKVFKEYIDKDWCFVTCRINNEKAQTDEFRTDKGMVNPLILIFPAKEIVYPLALTAVAGAETEVVLYVYGRAKAAADGRFELEYANQRNSRYEWDVLEFDETNTLSKKVLEFPRDYLTKFRGKLTPNDMRSDLIITAASDVNPYRKSKTHMGSLVFLAPFILGFVAMIIARIYYVVKKRPVPVFFRIDKYFDFASHEPRPPVRRYVPRKPPNKT